MKVPASRDEQELLPITQTSGDFTQPAVKRSNKDAAETSFPEQIGCSKLWRSLIGKILQNTGNSPVQKGEFKLTDEKKTCKDDMGKDSYLIKGMWTCFFAFAKWKLIGNTFAFY